MHLDQDFIVFRHWRRNLFGANDLRRTKGMGLIYMTTSEAVCGGARASWLPLTWPSAGRQARHLQHGLTPWVASWLLCRSWREVWRPAIRTHKIVANA